VRTIANMNAPYGRRYGHAFETLARVSSELFAVILQNGGLRNFHARMGEARSCETLYENSSICTIAPLQRRGVRSDTRRSRSILAMASNSLALCNSCSGSACDE